MPAAESADDLLGEREFPVPRELVFEVWTVAEHFARWFGPAGADMPMCEMDARPGGALRFQHRFPSGVGVSIRGVFDEVVRPSRLRFTFTFVDENDQPTAPPQVPGWPLGTHITMSVELSATRRGTRMAVYYRVADPDAINHPSVVRHRELAGMGWQQTAARLVEYLQQKSTQWPS